MSMFNTLCLRSTAPKIIKYLSNVHEKGGALLLCMNNDYAKFKYEGIRQMAENGFAPPPPREFCRHILSCRELKAESFKRCLHSVLRGVSL